MKNIVAIIRLSRPLHKLALGLSSLIVLSSAGHLAAPLLSKLVVDEIVLQVQTQTGDVTRLSWLIGLLFGLNVLGSLIEAVSNRIGDHFADRLKKFLTRIFYHKILRLPQQFFDTEMSGKILNQLSRGIQSIQDFSNTSSNFIVPSLLQSAFTIIILSYYNMWIGLFVIVLFPIYIGISYFSTKRWGVVEVIKNQHEDKLRSRIHEVIANIRLVKSFLTQLEEIGFVRHQLNRITGLYAKQSRQFHLYDFGRNMSLHIIMLLVNIIVFYNTFTGQMSIGEMVLVLQLLMQVRWPLFGMSFILARIQQAESGSKEFLEILNLPASETLQRPKQLKLVAKPKIVFDRVSFSYDEGKQTLRDLSFEILPTETIALVGHSGAGKSTIVNLILKLYEPTSGTIAINDHPYDKLGHATVRNHMSLVFQDHELFSSTVRANVAYGKEATSKQIIAALKHANAWDFVRELPQGLDAEIGERGVKLSGGQKQRIQIARAILHNTPILILDEATSNLDSRSEREVQKALEIVMQNRMVIIVAHRFSTIQNADRVFVIEDGRLVDSGKPKELSARKGIYSDLLRYQVEGNKKLLESFELY